MWTEPGTHEESIEGLPTRHRGVVGPVALPGRGEPQARRARPGDRGRTDRGILARRLAMADLAEGLAHDLKNQLTVVAASVQLARTPCSDPLSQDFLDRAFRATMRAARLLDEMLSYTRASGAPQEIDADLAEALETAVAAAWSHCSARSVDVVLPSAVEVPRVAAPPVALRVLLWRLLCHIADRARPGGCLFTEAVVTDDGVGLWVCLRPSEGDEARDAPGVCTRQDVQTAGAGTLGEVGGSGSGGPGPGTLDADEAAVIQALAAQAGATLRWESGGASLWLETARTV